MHHIRILYCLLPLASVCIVCIITTATDDLDFAPQDPVTITFLPGTLRSSRRCSQYQIVGDDFKEVDETFTINVVAENRYDLIRGPSNTVVTIESDQDCES